MSSLPLSLIVAASLLLQGIQIPQPRGYVNDFANVLSDASEAQMLRIIEDVRRKSGGEIAVVTLPDIGQRDVADVAREIGRQWKVGQAAEIGDRARNAGAVILLVPRETNSSGRGAARIETGLGTEGFITDATAGAILDEAVPFFQRQDYSSGVELMTLRVAERFAGEFGFEVDTSFQAPLMERGPVQRRSSRGIPPWLIFLIIFFVLSSFGGRGRRGRRGPRGCMPLILPFPMGGGGFHGGGFGGGGFGGGFGGGGFGGFGGGGGFGGRRREPRVVIMAKMTLDQLVTQLRAAFGTGLRSVVLYGSAAVGDGSQADQNVLVLVDALDVERLEAVAAVVRAWSDAGNPPPFTLTVEEWRRSADIFPMEYSDILERHRILHGDPPFEGLRIDPGDLRWQLELEAMGKLLHLRQGVLAAGGDGKRQLELLTMSKSAILVLFRATLRLHGQTPSRDPLEVVREAAAIAGFDAAPFERVIRHVRKQQAVRAAEAGALLADYVRGVERLVSYLDQHKSDTPTT